MVDGFNTKNLETSTVYSNKYFRSRKIKDRQMKYKSNIVLATNNYRESIFENEMKIL